MQVAAVQFKARERFEVGVAALVPLLRRAAGAELVVVPELALRGYGFADRAAVEAVAEPADGPTLAALAPEARRLGAWLVAGFPERDAGRLYNSALVIDPGGALAGVYRKSLLFEADLPWATPGGGGYAVYGAAGARFTVGICMDLNDDRFVGWCAGAGVRAVALPTNWIQEDGEVWPYWAWRLREGWPDALEVPGGDAQRARFDGALIGANSYGGEGAWWLAGRSAVLTADRVLCGAPPAGDGVLRATLP